MKATVAIHSTEACLVTRAYCIRILIQTPSCVIEGRCWVVRCRALYAGSPVFDSHHEGRLLSV